MHQHAGDNTGWAGDAFLDYIISLGDEVISAYFNELAGEVKPLIGTCERQPRGRHCGGRDGRLSTLAPVLLPSGTVRHAHHALQMAQAVMGDMQANQPPDVNENAVSFIRDWVTSGSTRNFGKDCTGTCYGFLEGRGGVYHPDLAACEALEHAGFPYRKTMKHLCGYRRYRSRRG